MSSFDNSAAWITGHKVHPFKVAPAPAGTPEEGQVLIKNRAIGVNPIEFKLQTTDLHMEDFTYPAIYGEDVAGEVVAVGPGVTKFKVGDRIAGIGAGFATKKNEEKAFQKYTILRTNLSTKIPDKYSYEEFSVFPLCASTACAGLFHPEFLNLQLPTHPPQKPTGEVLLVWGGASAVGGSAIQLAVAAGYEVITTSSPKNFEAMKKLGASFVVDYKSPTAVAELLNYVKGKKSAGIYDSIGPEAGLQIGEYSAKAEGKKFIASVIPSFVPGVPPPGVEYKNVFSLSIMWNHVASAVWDDYLPKAIEAGAFVPFPEPLIKGHSLEDVQGAVDYLRDNGVSAQKVVVSLE